MYICSLVQAITDHADRGTSPLTCSHIAEDVSLADVVGHDVFVRPEGAALGRGLGVTVQEIRNRQ